MPELSRDTSHGWRRRERAQHRLDFDALTEGLIVAKVSSRARDVVFVKGVFEASEGLALVFAERGGELAIATSPALRGELERVLSDLAAEGWIQHFAFASAGESQGAKSDFDDQLTG